MSVVVAVVAPALSVALAAPAAAAPAELATETAASSAARAYGDPVRVAEATTETSEVVANPDGSFTLTRHVEPVRVRRDGGWVPVDTTLVRRPDGTVGPRAAAVELSLSGGGSGRDDDSLVTVTKAGKQVGLGWSGPLPEPSLSGDVATYAEVLPGVDLKVQAEADGFNETLVVKTAAAGRNPVLDAIVFPNHASNATVREEADGELSATTAAGQEVFAAPAPKMWDSSGMDADPVGLIGGPATGGRTAVMEAEVSAAALTVVPSAAMLDDPATRFPVYIDPSYNCTTCGRTHYAVLYKTGLTEYDTDDQLRAGFVWDQQQAKYVTARSYVELNLAGLVGKYIHSADLHLDVNHSYSCSGTTNVFLTDGFDASTRFAAAPVARRLLGSVTSYGGCPNAGGVDINVKPTMEEAARDGWVRTFVGLLGADETNQNNWKRYGTNPYLVVKYNSYPNVPTDLTVRHATLDFPCGTESNRPYIRTTTPRLRALLTDPDNADYLDAVFYWWRHGETTTSSGYVNFVQPGSVAEVEVPPGALQDGQAYVWQARSSDHDRLSPWSVNCHFAVDATAPGVAAVSSADYPELGVAGAAGKTGVFTLSANGSADVASFVYTVDGSDPSTLGSPSVQATAIGGTAPILVTPVEGANVLRVASVDRAGNRGPVKDYAFRAHPPTAPVGVWLMDGTLTDATGGGRQLTYAGSGAAAYEGGYSGSGLRLTSATADTAASAASVVRTDRGFSAAAWVRLDAASGWRAVLSQDGPLSSAFVLERCDDTGKWCLLASPADAASPAWTTVHSLSSAQPGVWTHVAGVYDAGAKEIRIFVNGRLEGTKTATVGNIDGKFVVGRGKQNGAAVGQFTGVIDDVRLWDRTITAAEAATLANVAVPRARFKLDEGSGVTTRDEVTGTNATLTGGTQWSEDPEDPSIVGARFVTSPVGDITASRPAALQSGRSVTMSAWVKLESTTGFRTIVSIDGQRSSRVMLRYCGDQQKWCFGVSQTDVDSPVWTMAYSAVPVSAGQWVYLTGVYDAVTGTARLYVNAIGDTVASESGPGVTVGVDGGIVVGRAKQNGSPSAYFAGSVDDVRVYSGVQSVGEIQLDMRAREFGL